MQEKDSSITHLFLLVISSIVLILSIYRDYGITWDEPDLLVYGEYVLRWFTTLSSDKSALLYKDLPAYGGAIPLFSHLACRYSAPGSCYDTVHLFIALIGLGGLIGSFVVARAVGAPGTLAFCLLAICARFSGDMFQNLKDIPFATAYIWGIAALLCLWAQAPNYWNRRQVVFATVATGCALAVRTGGVFLWLLLGIVYAKWIFLRALTLKKGIFTSSAILFGSLFIMSLFWPLAHQNPVTALGLSLGVMKQFPWKEQVLYDGEFLQPQKLPRTYIIHMMLRTLPEIMLVGLSLFIALAMTVPKAKMSWVSRGLHSPMSFVALSIIVPIVIVLAIKPTLYDGVRHFLFIIPSLAVLASAGLNFGSRYFTSKPLRRIYFGALGILGIIHCGYLYKLHPYQYIYYNHVLSGGVRGAHQKFELDYWIASGRSAFECTKQMIGNQTAVVSVSVHLPMAVFEPLNTSRSITLSRDSFQADIVLTPTRWNSDRSLEWPTIGEVRRDGVPLIFIKLNPKSLLQISSHRCF